MIQTFELSVYFDGLCPLCSKEIRHYQKQTGSEKIRFVDITSPEFDPAVEGLDPFKIHEVMHVKYINGVVKTEVDAFIAIWSVLPKYKFLIPIVEFKAVRPLANVAYRFFASQIRPRISKKSDDCKNSPYCKR